MPLKRPLLYTGRLRTCACADGALRPAHAASAATASALRLPGVIAQSRVVVSAAAFRRARRYSEPSSQVNHSSRNKTPVRSECGRADDDPVLLLNVSQSDPDAFQIAHGTAHPCPPRLAETQIDTQPKGESDIAPAARAQDGN